MAAATVRQSFATQLTYALSSIWNYAALMEVKDKKNTTKWKKAAPSHSDYGPGTAALGQPGRYLRESVWWQWLEENKVNTFSYPGMTIKWYHFFCFIYLYRLLLYALCINCIYIKHMCMYRCGIFNGYSDEAIRFIVNICQDPRYAHMSIFTQGKLFQCAQLKNATKEHQMWMLQRLVITCVKMNQAISQEKLGVVVDMWMRILHQKDMFEV